MKLLKILITVCLSLVSFELFLTFSPFKGGVSPVKYDPDIGMWHKSNFQYVNSNDCYNTKYEFDANGLIKNNYNFNPDKQDVLILGDSYIEALMIKNKNIIHNSLYRAYGGRLNFLNFGLGGTGPTQHLEILKKFANIRRAKYLIEFISLDEGWGRDLEEVDPGEFSWSNRPLVHLKFSDLEHYEIFKPPAINIKEKIREFLAQFELYGYLRKTLKYYKSKLSVIDSDISKIPYGSRDWARSWDQIKGSVFQINKISKANNIGHRVVVFSPDRNHNTVISEFLELQKIPFVDLVGELERLKIDLNSITFSCDGHWNDETHRLFSRIIRSKFSLEN
tara:strand:- start:1209 stop:2213 length:1005 start_codon:yes stop_codon:yes gene_type:complete